MTSSISRKSTKRKRSPNPTSGLTDQELTAAFRLKKDIDEHILSCYQTLMEIDGFIGERNSLKTTSVKKHDVASNLFGIQSVSTMYALYDKFLKRSREPGVRTILEIYASMAKPKRIEHKLTATVQAHSSEMVRTTLRNNNVLTLSLSGRPGESGLMEFAPNLKTNKDIISGELPRNRYTWNMVFLEKLEYISLYAPDAVHKYVEQIAKAHEPKIYGIDFWWSWYIHGFSLYANPTVDVKDAMYAEYTDLHTKIGGHSIRDIVELTRMKTKCSASTDTAANLYKLSRFLREAWASVGITFPGGGFNITCADHDHQHFLEPNKDEAPELCPVYGVSIAETNNADDFDFTNRGLPFLIHSTDDSVSAQAYRNAPHLADGANFAPLRTKMEENVKATYDKRCSVRDPNINLLDQQLYWLKKIINFCKDDHNQMVYYAYVYLSMVVKRRTTHSAMINMFQHGMGYAFTCLDPSCRWIPNLDKSHLARAAMQTSEYLKDIKIIEKIVQPGQPLQPGVLCHYVERTYNKGGIFVAGDIEMKEDDHAFLNTFETYKKTVEDPKQLKEFNEITKEILETSDILPQYIESRVIIFERIKEIIAELNSHKKHHSSPHAGGKRSSTRKRMAPIRRIRTRKNKRRIRYTKKIKNNY